MSETDTSSDDQSERSEREGRELTMLLEDAANGRPGAAAAFFERLLSADVFVPTRLQDGDAVPVIIEYADSECIPIFSQEEFVAKWSPDHEGIEQRKFSSLIWTVEDGVWLYLNASQDVGKEITAWEIEQCRRGVEAVPELVAAIGEEPLAEIEVRSNRDVFPELKQNIMSSLEVYPELEEAFLVAVKEGHDSAEKPLIGLKWGGQKSATEGKRAYIRSEIQSIAEEHSPTSGATVLDDLDDPDSPNHTLFSDATPFYFQKQVEKPSFFSRIFSVFSASGGASEGTAAAKAMADSLRAEEPDFDEPETDSEDKASGETPS